MYTLVGSPLQVKVEAPGLACHSTLPCPPRLLHALSPGHDVKLHDHSGPTEVEVRVLGRREDQWLIKHMR